MFPEERSIVSSPGTVTIIPSLFVPTTTLNHHMTAVASPNGASLNVQTLTCARQSPNPTGGHTIRILPCYLKHLSA